MIREFASKHCECTTITGRAQRCVIGATTSSCSPPLTKPTEKLLRRSGAVETLGTPKHRLPPRRSRRIPPTHFRLDAQREYHPIHNDASTRRPTQSRMFPPAALDHTFTPLPVTRRHSWPRISPLPEGCARRSQGGKQIWKLTFQPTDKLPRQTFLSVTKAERVYLTLAFRRS